MTATSAEWAVWTNGDDIAYLSRDRQRIRDNHLNNIPARGQTLEDVGQLNRSDLRPFNRSELKGAFRRILRTLYANTNIGRREKLGSEMTKVIFAKIEDEKTYCGRPPQFRARADENPKKVADRIKELFCRVRNELKHDGIFSEHETITLDDRSIAWVVGQLERGSLLETDSDVVGDAFEVFSESKFIGEKGEFFTPRGVVRIAVKLANPAPRDTVCDPACGSGGFLIHAMKHVWERMADDPEWCGAANLTDHQKQMAARSFFGIDKETDLVKIAKAHMAIAGDGRSNIVHENALRRAQDFEADAARFLVENGHLRCFDMVLTNPPFGTRTKVNAEDAASFVLGQKWRKRNNNSWEADHDFVDRDPYVLFIERCLGILRREGKLAIVLPETVFHAPTLGYVRRYLLERNNLKAVIDLPHNTFRPHCNAKTCLLVLTKEDRQQERVVMATPKEMGHDHTGRPLYRPHSGKIWDDLADVLVELDQCDSSSNEHVFTVPWNEINVDALVPRYYRWRLNPPRMPQGCYGVRLDTLIGGAKGLGWPRLARISGQGRGQHPIYPSVGHRELGTLPQPSIRDSRGCLRTVSGKQAKTRGRRHYLRAPRQLPHWHGRNGIRTRRASLTHARALDAPSAGKRTWPDAVLPARHAIVKERSGTNQQSCFFDTTLPNIGDRWRYLTIPVHEDADEVARISAEVEKSIRSKWAAQDGINVLREQLGGIVT